MEGKGDRLEGSVLLKRKLGGIEVGDGDGGRERG